MHLLAIDDEPSILELLETLIQFDADHTVETASSVADALELLARPGAKAFDCFIADIQMPGTDGIELCQILRGRPDNRQTPVLMLTAMSEYSYIDRAFSAGANDYITKPFDIMKLRALIGQLDKRLARRHSRKEGGEICALEDLSNSKKVSVTLKLGNERIRMGYGVPKVAVTG